MSDNVCDNGYDELEDYNIGEEYQEADGDCVEEEYYVDPDEECEGDEGDEGEQSEQEENEGGEEEETEEVREEDEEEEENQYEYPLGDESVELHDEDDGDDIVFSSEQNQPDDADEEEEEHEDEEATHDDEPKEAKDDDEEGDEEQEDMQDNEEEKEKEEEKKEEETKIECTMTEEEIKAEYQILDGYQREIDEEQYTLRKLRSIIGHQSDDIERLRKKIAVYTQEAEDRKALQGMDKLKVLKAERENAVEERRVSTDAKAEIRSKRNEKIKELKAKGLIIDPRATYLIEDEDLKELLRKIKSTLKYNSFATLKISLEELEEVIFNVANVCDDIDEFLTAKEIKPRDINKLTTKERRVSVLYDKLLKWRQYKVENPDLRPTEYESFLYDPEDMFSDNEQEKKRRKEPPPRRDIRAVRGGSSDKSPIKEKASSKARAPVRAPSPRKSPAARPERRAVRGGSPDEEGSAHVRDESRAAKAPRGGKRGSSSSGPRRGPPRGAMRKRRGGHLEGGPGKKRNMSPTPRRSRFSPPRGNRSPSPRMERRLSPREDRRSSGPTRNEGGRHESGRARSTPLLRTPNSSYDPRCSPSPPYKGGGRRENFQISVRNESYRSRSPMQDRGYRQDRSPDRSPPRSHGYRGSRGRGRNNMRRPRRANFDNRRTDSYKR